MQSLLSLAEQELEAYKLELEQLRAELPDPDTLWSDEPPLESSEHWKQLEILVNSLEWFWQDRDDFFIGANLTIYFSLEEYRERHFRGPDFFLVKGTQRRPRKSWVVWAEEGKYPDLIIELLSDSTVWIDRGPKKELYAQVFRTPEYFWFSPETQEFEGFHLANGDYEPIPVDERGWRWSKVLELYLGVWGGRLRFFSAEGELVPTPTEAAKAERQRAERLASELRARGVDPDQLDP